MFPFRSKHTVFIQYGETYVNVTFTSVFNSVSHNSCAFHYGQIAFKLFTKPLKKTEFIDVPEQHKHLSPQCIAEHWSGKGSKATHYQQPAMHLDDMGDLVAVFDGLIGQIELEGNAEVAANDDYRRHDQVKGEHGDDERETLLFHVSPG